MEAGRCAHPGPPPKGRRPALHPEPQRRHRPAAHDRRRGARPERHRGDPGRGGLRGRPGRRRCRPVPGHDEPLLPSRAGASHRSPGALLRHIAPGRRRPHRPAPGGEAADPRSGGRRSPGSRDPDRRCRAGRGLLRRRPGPWPRGSDGQVGPQPLRSGAPWKRVAQGEAGSHLRPGRPGG